MLIFSVARIFFINVFTIKMIRSRLRNIHKYLIAKADESSERATFNGTEDRDDSEHFLLQYLDPLLWAAKLSGSRRFDAVTDSDLSKLCNGISITFDEVLEEGNGFTSVVRVDPGREI